MKEIISQIGKKNQSEGRFSTFPIQKAHGWEEVVKSYNCFFCQKNFTEKDIQKKNYQLTYSIVYGAVEVYHVYHLQHREHYPNGINCDICQKPINNLIMLDELERTYHLECFKSEKIIYHRKHSHPQLFKCGCC